MSTRLPSTFRRRAARPSPRAAAGAALLINACLVASHDAAAAVEVANEPLARVRAAAEEVIRAQLHGALQGVHIRAADPDERLRLPRCPGPLAASPAAGAELRANMTVRVSCNAQHLSWAVYVPVTIDSDVSVLVLRQSAIKGARLTAGQVGFETRRISGLAAGYVTDVALLEHHTLTRTLPAGTALTEDALLADAIIRQGQLVTLVAAAPGIEVRAPARALEDGREGARVRVQNLASLKIVQGVVDPSGLIYVTP